MFNPLKPIQLVEIEPGLFAGPVKQYDLKPITHPIVSDKALEMKRTGAC